MWLNEWRKKKVIEVVTERLNTLVSMGWTGDINWLQWCRSTEDYAASFHTKNMNKVRLWVRKLTLINNIHGSWVLKGGRGLFLLLAAH